ncbi:Hypothetical protein, putative [Bodo saltans]|uniref:Uncharacterized protein n=1 Tax=Bodo saltans TaxID=75058 RepID=A0A0S4ISG2_BODSA|nr:Hypothetical protein, putative [Bodo saltans]|eukprot:CUG05876.1 Hypothetical protein, putative [Bodo saltans]
MSAPGIDVDAALAELQHLISSVAASHGNDIDPALITQRLRSLENELRRSESSARASLSPSPRRQSSLTQIPASLQAQLLSKAASPLERASSPLSSSNSNHHKMVTLVAPEPSLRDIRRSVSCTTRMLQDHEEDKWQLSRGGSSSYATTSSSAAAAARPQPPRHLDAASALNRSSLDVSFAQQYAGDDPQRLRFVIDAVSNQLQKERRWRRQLQNVVIPSLLQHVEVLEQDRDRLQSDLAAAHHEVTALKLQRAIGGRLELNQQVDMCLEQVSDLLAKLRAR